MKASRNWLQTFFDTPIPSARELEELFTFHSFEVESMEKHGDDDILDVKVLPDRAHYCLSHAGIAREISVLTKQPLKANRIPPMPSATRETAPSVRIEAPGFCRRYMARYGEIPNVAPSNPLAAEMLGSIGERSINALVDASNVTMFDCGQPLHIFDADQVRGTIVIRAAKKGETMDVLDSAAGSNRTVELVPTDHVIADDLGPLVIAGVKGGKRAAVTSATKRIIIESANFDPSSVRRTATRLNLRSEASRRYENEITPELAVNGMTSVCGLILHNIPGATFGPVVDEYPRKAARTVIELDPKLISERLGVQVPLAEARSILERMGITVEDHGNTWKLTVPFERLDLTIPEDFVEEVGRVWGYEHVTGILPPASASAVPILPSFYLAERIRNELVELGFSEVDLYTLVATGHIETAYPLAKDKAFARANLSDGMMQCLERNALNADLLGLDAVRAFEIGKIFTKEGEILALVIGAAQVKKAKGLKSEDHIAAAIEALSKKIGISIPAAKPIVKGTCAVLEIDLDRVLGSYKVPSGASYKDLAFSRASENRYEKISPYPFIVRDIAVFVPEAIRADAVWTEIAKGIAAAGATGLLVRRALFDTFKKEGKVSYAFRMVFQSMERTLTDAEANAIMGSVYAGMKAAGWEVR